MAGFREKLQGWRRDRKGDGQARPNAALVASSARGSNDIQQERSRDSLASLVNHQELPATQSLWDRAYDALAKKKTELVKDYETLLAKEEQMANSTSNNEPPAQPILPRDVTYSPDSPSRQAQLNTVIKQGLRRMEETKATYNIAGHEFVLTDQVTQAAKLLLWAKDWIGGAVQASPAASIAWAGICLILPLLTNPTTAVEASRDGFTDATARMRYYVALEPLLRRLGQNARVADVLMSDAEDHIIDLYQNILEFQICSVLRFYQSRLKTYVKDMLQSKDWKQMTLDIKTREETVNKDLSQINELVARQELEILNKTSINTLEAMKGFLSVSTQQLAVLKEQLVIQQDAVRQKLSNEQKKCLQLFRLTSNDKDVTYEWYKDRVEDRIQNTCLWFLQHDHFQRWLAQESGPLLVSADPGCGKSVLAKYLIDYMSSQQSAIICYYFFKDQDQNTARQALCALLHQLLSQIPALIGHAMEPYAKEGPGLIHSTKSLWTIFTNAVHDPQAGPVTVVLDALDECADDQFQDLLRNVESQFSRHPGHARLKFLMTSRPYERVISEFQDLLESFPLIYIPGEEESKTISLEINLVIQNRVNRLARKKKLSVETKNCLANKLLSIQHRTYLWVYLVFNYLETKTLLDTTKSVAAAIATLPKTVNDAYEQILSKSEQDPIVRRILSVILAAKRPLTLPEMNVVVNMDDEINKKMKSSPFGGLMLGCDETFKFHLKSLCGLFVSVHHNNIYFLHQTAREFLLRTDLSRSSVAVSSEIRWHHSITIRDAHTILAKLCVLYLSFFTSNASLLPKGDARLALLNYSAKYWGTHFHEAGIVDDAAIVPLASGICESNSKSHSIWSNIYCDTIFELNPKCFAGLLVASYFGHNSVARLLLEKGADVEAKDHGGLTPLSFAAYRGHEAVARLLLEKGADVEAKDDDGLTPLSYAAYGGHEAVAQLLLKNDADVEAKTNAGWTPLFYTADEGHEAVARLLLKNGADVEAKTNGGRTPLFRAAERGHEAVARLLLKNGADVEANGHAGWTPLSYVADRGQEAVARLLLENGADVEAKTNGGWTPLFRAAERGHEAVARLLLKNGADVEAKDRDGRTPLFRATGRGHEAVARLLLENGADVKAKDARGQTPFLHVADRGQEAVARLLLKNGADVEAKDHDGRTPLSYVAGRGLEAFFRLLLENGADIEAKDHDGRTPLSLATERGHKAVVKLLGSHGVRS